MVVMPKQNVPALRLEGFSGEWGTTIVSAVADVVGGGTPSTSNPSLWDGDIDWYSPNEVGSDVVAKPSNRRITVEGLRASSAQLLPAHRTILYTSRASIGHTAILKHPATTNQGFQSLVLRDGMDTYFMYSLTPLITRKALKISSGSTFLEISAKALGTIEIPVPSTLEEQQAIGAIFTNLDAAINQHTLKHKALQQAKTALMQRMFPQEGQTVPELRLEGFSGEWKTASIGAVSALHNGRDYKHLGEGCIPVYGTGGYMAAVDQALSHDKDAVGIGRKGTINKPYILKAPFWTVDTLFYVVPNQDTDLAFFYASVLRVDWMAKNTATGLPSLTSQAINSADISVPPTLEEQQAIGAIFTNLDQLIAAEAQYIASLKQAKTALLQRMFI